MLVVVVAALVVATLVARRRGYTLGGDTPVRCRRGHLFTTLWVPGVSVTSVRLGWYRFQYCPVGAHWSLVHPVRVADLSDDEVRSARAVHDLRVP